MPFYFAYGSNLKAARMRARVGEVRHVCAAKYEDARLGFRKHGADGSGKACCESAPGNCVWGFVYELQEAQLKVLDQIEQGYARETVALRAADGARISAATYRAVQLGPHDSPPFRWYRALMVEGAREHGLPAHWQAKLAALPAIAAAPETQT